MKNYLNLITVFGFIMLTSFTGKQNNGATNYYGIPESINFNKLNYSLFWSSHPNDNYFKQEYIPADNKAKKYKDLILIDFIITDTSVLTAVGAQLAIIQERKKTDIICNYQLLANKETGEYILDFLISGSDDDNNLTLVEWDGYRYKPYTDSAGHKGVLLFGVSHRAYGNYATSFMRSLRDYRNNSLKMLNAYEIPAIQIKQNR